MLRYETSLCPHSHSMTEMLHAYLPLRSLYPAALGLERQTYNLQLRGICQRLPGHSRGSR